MTINKGLEGVVAAETALSLVDGERGELIIAGFPVAELAPNATFEETVSLLWDVPYVAGRRHIPESTIALLRDAAHDRVDTMDALRMGAGTIRGEAPADVLAALPTIVAAYWRLLNRRQPIAPRHDLGHAANYLYMLSGGVPSAERVRGLETYLNTVVDHGLNASTFTARVIISTGSDLVSAVVGAVGALKGPLHGGAPGPALDMVFEIGEPDRAEAVLREKFKRGERLMGFGHRVYRVRDPRADVLAAACERLYQTEADMKLYELSRHVERTALRLLDEYKPGRKLQTNVEFYTALLLHGLDLPTDLFTPTFAVSRVAGWLAHCFEQQKQNRLIRPDSEYVGVKNRRWKPAEER